MDSPFGAYPSSRSIPDEFAAGDPVVIEDDEWEGDEELTQREREYQAAMQDPPEPKQTA